MFKILFAVVLTVFSLPISLYYHDSAIASVKSRRTCSLLHSRVKKKRLSSRLQDLCFTSKLLYGCDGTRALIGLLAVRNPPVNAHGHYRFFPPRFLFTNPSELSYFC